MRTSCATAAGTRDASPMRLSILGEKNERIKSVDVPKLIDPSFVRSAVDRGLAADH